ncbi:hypothetical protein BDV29DRAFT_172655 [Aspergillus leporis]|uniref:Uncharacterized protein n=1 Tax=Aspergillus leporis TaxID=41062 RepID=A0A5N5X4S3_9EURO|nr:hypothetical protein BDV29DRAFT_172655 [Aspergillus leporis]
MPTIYHSPETASSCVHPLSYLNHTLFGLSISYPHYTRYSTFTVLNISNLAVATRMATERSLDFCLVCGRQTLGELYCSQSCRLAELNLTTLSTTISVSASVHRENFRKVTSRRYLPGH